METALQPAAVPPEFLKRVKTWANGQADSVSVILFGSRARGDYGPESDWDFAVVYEGEEPRVEALPVSLGGDSIDWVPMERSHAAHLVNLSHLHHAIAQQGLCLHGNPLPTPERADVTFANAWDSLHQGLQEISGATVGLVSYWGSPAIRRSLGNRAPAVASGSAAAAEMLCKSALYMRGSGEPDHTPSIEDLCDDLDRLSPADPLAPLLRECNGKALSAHFDKYSDKKKNREKLSYSEARLVACVRASGAVLSELCKASPADEGRVHLAGIMALRPQFLDCMARLTASNYHPDTLRALEGAAQSWPLVSRLQELLEADPPSQAKG